MSVQSKIISIFLIIIVLLGAIGFGNMVNEIPKTLRSNCKLDCENFTYEYFRFKLGGFANSECWCKINSTSTIQIR